MAPKIRCGGYKTPFDPFLRPDGTRVCDPEGTDLALWANKLGAKQQDKWLAAASWRDPEGKIRGAMAWKAATGRGDVYWNEQPLSYDPRPAEDRESWGEHRPRYGGNGWWTGAVFPDARDVEISNPADVSATTYQLAPGTTIVPQLTAPYFGGYVALVGFTYLSFNVDGSYQRRDSRITMPASPIAGYTAMAAHAFGPRVDGRIYKFNNSYYQKKYWSSTTATYYVGSVFGYSVFYANKTPAEIPATHEVAAPLSRPPQAGDFVATYLGRSITYQKSQIDSYGYVDEFEQDQTAFTAPIPAGTLVTYTWAQPSAEKIAPVTSRANAVDGFGTPYESSGLTDDGINRCYGVNFKGSNSASQVNRSGKCYIFEWWRDQYVLHEGTYSIKQTSKVEVEDDRPVNSSGPNTSAGWGGWPSKRQQCERSLVGLAPYSASYLEGRNYEVTNASVTLTWIGLFNGKNYGSRDIPYVSATFVGPQTKVESGYYNPTQGNRPSYIQRTRQVAYSYHAEQPRIVQNLYGSGGQGDGKVVFVGTVERNGFGQRIGGCESETNPSVNPATGGLVDLGSDGETCTFSNGSPATCGVVGAYFHGGLITDTTTEYYGELRPGNAPGIPNPNCPAQSAVPGSAIPGFPGSGAPLPPGGNGNRATASNVSDVEIEYEIQAPIARGMTSRSYYYEKTSTTEGGTAQWNGSIEASTYTPIETTTSTLEFREPVTLIRDDLAGYEEVVFVVLEFDRKTGAFSTNPPPAADRATVYYQRQGGSPVVIVEAIKDEFPEAAWADPRSWNWTQWMGLKGGVLYLYKNDPQTLDSYKSKSAKVKASRYLVSDGSFLLQGVKSFEALSLGARNAVIFDHHAFG